MPATTQQEAAAIVRTLQRYTYAINRDLKKFLVHAAVPVEQIARARVPVGSKVHFRYSTPKVDNRRRAPRGMGRAIAAYNPGNLRGSIRTLQFPRAVDAVFVGPKLAKRGGKGTYGPGRPDGYYAHMVEKGTKFMSARPFIQPAAQQGLPLAYRRLETSCRLLTEKFNRP